MTGAPDEEGGAGRAAVPCPICGKPRVERYRPFCSKRCADVDLGRWFAGVYAVPAEEDEDVPDET